MKKIINKIFNTKTKMFVAGLLATIGVTGAVAIAGFGPERPTYDYNDPVDRKGSLIGPVFNSFRNAPGYGDERNFVRIAPVVAGQKPGDADFKEEATAEGGKEYWVRTYVHNNANQSMNDADDNFIGVAKNTHVKVAIAQGLANGVDVMSYITADNAKNKSGEPMGTIWDTSTLRNNTTAFSVSYVPGSASIINGVHPNGLPLSDEVVGANGVKVGYDQMNGDFPGCFEFAAMVYVKVKVSSPKLELTKTVRLPGTTEWKEMVDTKPGDTVQWHVKVMNTGTGSAVQNNVVASDLLPPHLEYVAGSAKWYTASAPNGLEYDFNKFIINQGKGGLIFGNYAPNGGLSIRFDTKVKGDFTQCSVVIRNLAHSRSDQQKVELTDHADVRITKENCNNPVPVFSCDLLTAVAVDGKPKTFKFTAKATALNGAKIKRYHYNFGDNTTVLISDKNVVEHTFATDGTFNPTVKVEVEVNGKLEIVTAVACGLTIISTSNTTPPIVLSSTTTTNTTTTTPATLPATGPASVAGIFGSVSAISAAAYHFVRRRF